MSVFFDPFRSLSNEPFGQQFGSALSAGGDAGLYPDTENLLAWYRTEIVDDKLVAWLPPGTNHTTQQVKSSGFSGAGSATVAGLLTSDVITTPHGTVTGAEVMGDYSFDAGITGWGSSDASLAIANTLSGMSIVASAATGTYYNVTRTSIAIEANTLVKVKIKLKSVTAFPTSGLRFYTNGGVLVQVVNTLVEQVFEVYTYNLNTFVMRVNGGLNVDVDYISVQRIQQKTPTCTTNGILTFWADCWDIGVHRAGVLWASWKGINVGATFELDASGMDHHLYLTTTTITERTDGTGTNWWNEMGGSIADGSQYLEETGETAIGAGWRIPALVDGSGCASWSAA